MRGGTAGHDQLQIGFQYVSSDAVVGLCAGRPHHRSAMNGSVVPVNASYRSRTHFRSPFPKCVTQLMKFVSWEGREAKLSRLRQFTMIDVRESWLGLSEQFAGCCYVDFFDRAGRDALYVGLWITAVSAFSAIRRGSSVFRRANIPRRLTGFLQAASCRRPLGQIFPPPPPRLDGNAHAQPVTTARLIVRCDADLLKRYVERADKAFKCITKVMPPGSQGRLSAG